MRRFRRRRFLLAAGALAAAPFARAQAPIEKRTLGVLSPHPRETAQQNAPINARFRQLGWDFGKNLSITKVLEIFRQIAPQATRIAALATPSASGTLDGRPHQVPMINDAAQSLGFDYRTYRVSNAEDIDAALVAALEDGMQGIAVYGTTTTFRQRHRIAEFANRHRLVSGSTQERFADAGCLFAYGPSTENTIVQTIGYVDRVLRGANPSDLPVELPERYELALNLGTAKLLGLTIPGDVLLRADRVIE